MSPDPQELYLAVTARLDAAPPPPLEGAPHGEPLTGQLAAILALARGAAAALNACLPGASLDDKNKYAHLGSMLERIASFQSFSLAEYSYHLPDGRRPGVRLWLEEERWRRYVRVLLFAEVGRWRADAAGRLASRELISLELGEKGPSPILAPHLNRFFPAAWGWEQCLTMALCLAACL